jgi:hypothetical protein
MFDTVRHRPSKRIFGRSAKLVLTVAAAFTLLAGGTALATTATASGADTHQGPTAQSSLHADDPSITGVETEKPDSDAADDAAKDAAEAAKEAADQADDANTTDGAQGVHGACVSDTVSDAAHNKLLVGRDHGVAVSTAAHACPKGSGDVAGAAKGAAKSAAAQAKRAVKLAARTARGKG